MRKVGTAASRKSIKAKECTQASKEERKHSSTLSILPCSNPVASQDPGKKNQRYKKTLQIIKFQKISRAKPEAKKAGASGANASEKGIIRKRKWTPEEDSLVCNLVNKHGTKAWIKVAQMLSQITGCRYRTNKQVRERYNNYLRPLINSNQMTMEECYTLLSLVKENGTKWSRIIKHFPNRSFNTIKNFYNIFSKKLIIEIDQILLHYDRQVHQVLDLTSSQKVNCLWLYSNILVSKEYNFSQLKQVDPEVFTKMEEDLLLVEFQIHQSKDQSKLGLQGSNEETKENSLSHKQLRADGRLKQESSRTESIHSYLELPLTLEEQRRQYLIFNENYIKIHFGTSEEDQIQEQYVGLMISPSARNSGSIVENMPPPILTSLMLDEKFIEHQHLKGLVTNPLPAFAIEEKEIVRDGLLGLRKYEPLSLPEYLNLIKKTKETAKIQGQEVYSSHSTAAQFSNTQIPAQSFPGHNPSQISFPHSLSTLGNVQKNGSFNLQVNQYEQSFGAGQFNLSPSNVYQPIPLPQVCRASLFDFGTIGVNQNHQMPGVQTHATGGQFGQNLLGGNQITLNQQSQPCYMRFF